MQKNGRKDLIIDLLLLLAAGVVFCAYAIVNGYPLVYSDTGTYINSGFENEVPFDRPILYGLFLRHISLKATLWLPVFFQGLMTAWSIRLLINQFPWTKSFRRKVFVSCIAILTVFTGVAQKTSNLLPDFTTALIPIIAVAFLLGEKLSRTEKVVALILLFFSFLAHGSNLYIGLLAVLILSILRLILRARFKLTDKKQLIYLWSVTGTAFALMLIVNACYTGKPFISRNGSVFMTGHLADCGLLDEFLIEKCEEKHYELCEWKGTFSQVDFLWDDVSSPHYKTGGWDTNEGRYNPMLRDFFTSPKFLGKYIASTLILGGKQIFDSGLHADMENLPMKEGSAPYGQIKWRYPSELTDYTSARQYNNRLDYSVSNMLQNAALLLSIILIPLGCVYLRSRSNAYRNIIIVLIFSVSTIFSNGIVCAGLTISNSRFGSRVIWLIPFVMVLIVAEMIRYKKSMNTIAGK